MVVIMVQLSLLRHSRWKDHYQSYRISRKSWLIQSQDGLRGERIVQMTPCLGQELLEEIPSEQ